MNAIPVRRGAFGSALLMAVCLIASVHADPPSTPKHSEWSDFLDSLRPLGGLNRATLSPKDERIRQEVYRQLMYGLGTGALTLFTADPDYPDWTPFLNYSFNLAAPNADTIYYRAPVRGDGTYRLTGHRGTVLFVVISLSGGGAPTGPFRITDQPSGQPWAADSYYLDDFHIEEDGSFEIIFAPQKPAWYQGENWRPLKPQMTSLGVRQVAYDWNTEEDAQFAIERVDVPAARPRATADDIRKRLGQVVTWIESSVGYWYDVVADMHDRGVINTLEYNRFSDIGGLGTQYYYQGIFRIAADEALIMETAVPEKCQYWSVQLTDELFSTIDYYTRQASLNARQVRLDADGKFRAVVALQDPGVPNWLDTGGYEQGTIQGRWNHCDSHPLPSLKKVPFDDLRSHLPEDTPSVTPAEREQSLRLRRRGGQLRRRW